MAKRHASIRAKALAEYGARYSSAQFSGQKKKFLNHYLWLY